MKKYPQWKEICSTSRKTLKSFKYQTELGNRNRNKLVDLEDRSSWYNLRNNGIKEGNVFLVLCSVVVARSRRFF